MTMKTRQLFLCVLDLAAAGLLAAQMPQAARRDSASVMQFLEMVPG